MQSRAGLALREDHSKNPLEYFYGDISGKYETKNTKLIIRVLTGAIEKADGRVAL